MVSATGPSPSLDPHPEDTVPTVQVCAHRFGRAVDEVVVLKRPTYLSALHAESLCAQSGFEAENRFDSTLAINRQNAQREGARVFSLLHTAQYLQPAQREKLPVARQHFIQIRKGQRKAYRF